MGYDYNSDGVSQMNHGQTTKQPSNGVRASRRYQAAIHSTGLLPTVQRYCRSMDSRSPSRKVTESMYVQAAPSTSDTNAESDPTPSMQEMRILLLRACTATSLFL